MSPERSPLVLFVELVLDAGCGASLTDANENHV